MDHEILPIDVLVATLKERDAQINMLQTRSTELENDRRYWKARAETAISYLTTVLVELPLKLAQMPPGVPRTDVMRDLYQRVDDESKCSDLILQDAWSKAAQYAREFVKAIDNGEGRDYQFLGTWYDKFKSL